MEKARPDGGLRRVRLERFPVDLWTRADAETRDLMREFVLMTIDHDHAVPRQLLQIVSELQERYGAISSDQTARLERARQAGQQTIDELVYEVPAGIAGDIRRLGEILDQADEYCRRGEHLLSLASSPGAKAFRDWFLDEFTHQLGGAEPTPWPESRQARELANAASP